MEHRKTYDMPSFLLGDDYLTFMEGVSDVRSLQSRVVCAFFAQITVHSFFFVHRRTLHTHTHTVIHCTVTSPEIIFITLHQVFLNMIHLCVIHTRSVYSSSVSRSESWRNLSLIHMQVNGGSVYFPPITWSPSVPSASFAGRQHTERD